MFGIINHSIIFLQDVRYIFSPDRGIKDRSRLFFTNIRLKVKQKFIQVFRLDVHEETIFGLRVAFSDYGWFTHLWREIFLAENYYFKAPHDAPFIIDAGSNQGMSILYFKTVYPKATIIGFEPDKDAFARLSANVANNRLEGVTLHNEALGSAEGTRDFYADPHLEGSGINGLDPMIASDASLMKKTTTPVRKLSSYINAPVDLLKMDVEGGEFDIMTELDGAKKLSSVTHIIMEIHQNASAKNTPIASLLDLFDKNNLRYCLTDSIGSHAAFEADPARSYAFMLSAEKIKA